METAGVTREWAARRAALESELAQYRAIYPNGHSIWTLIFPTRTQIDEIKARHHHHYPWEIEILLVILLQKCVLIMQYYNNNE